MAATIWFSGFIILVLCFSTINSDQEKNILVKEKEILDSILNSTTYDFRVRPMENNEVMTPTKIKVNMYVLMISRIDDIRMQYNTQIYLRQNWMDKRLKYDCLGGKLKSITLFEEKIWTPDLFIANERSGYINNILKPNKFVRISPDGSVQYSVRVSLVLSCPMNFHFFPFDTQVCGMSMESYGFSNEDVAYEWHERYPVGMPENFEFAHYSMQKYKTESSHIALKSGNYSSLKVSFHLKRKINHHLIHLFIPSFMLVVTSWITFWLDHQVVMTRLFVVLTTLLVVSYKFSDFNATLTPVSYTKSVDIWTGTCSTFLFLAVIEVVMVEYRCRQQQKKQRRAAGILESADEESGIDLRPLVSNSSSNATDINAHSAQGGRLWNYCYRLVPRLPAGPKRLDVASRYLFPISFALFNVFYWLVNLVYYVL